VMLPQERVDEGDGGSVGSFAVVLGAKNEGVIVWDQFDGVRSNLWSRRLLGANMIVPESRESASTGDALSPSLAVDGQGRIILIWNQVDTGSKELWESVYKPGLGWSEGASLGQPVSRVESVAMSIDREGHATVLSTSGQSRLSTVSAKRKLKVTGWIDSSIISSSGQSSADVLLSGSPVLTTIYEDGRVLALWAQYGNIPDENNLPDNRYRMMMTLYDAKSLSER
jgi:hypothetical protein